MNISQADLIAEFERASQMWPFISGQESTHDLPVCLLFAVGSRETNLTNENGDGGHGRGVFQLDDRSHQIPDPFHVSEQAAIAAAMLAGAISHFDGNVHAGVASYNCGEGGAAAGLRDHGNPDAFTTGRDYGADVLERMAMLQQHIGHKTAPAAPRLLRLEKQPMRGPDVRAVQEALLKAKLSLNDGADGVYGPHTAAAVEAFQKAHHLAVDGLVGAQTRKALGL